MVVIFHGDKRAQKELLDALTRNCECKTGPFGVNTVRCPGHTAFVSDQAWVDRLLFYRSIRLQLNVEEYTLKEKPA